MNRTNDLNASDLLSEKDRQEMVNEINGEDEEIDKASTYEELDGNVNKRYKFRKINGRNIECQNKEYTFEVGKI